MSSSNPSHRIGRGTAAAFLTLAALTLAGCSSDDGVESLRASSSDSAAVVALGETGTEALAYADNGGTAESGAGTSTANGSDANNSGLKDRRDDDTNLAVQDDGTTDTTTTVVAATSPSTAHATTTSSAGITADSTENGATENGETGTMVPSASGGSSTTSAPKTATSTTANPTATTTTTTAAPTTAAPTTTVATTGPTGPVTSGTLFADPYNSATAWAAANPSDPRASVIAQLGQEPVMKWFGDWNSSVKGDVATYVSQAQGAGAVPMMVVYNIPDRDCGQHSSGGAASFGAYETWITSFADGLGDGPALIVLEPDALALNGCAGSGRNQALQNAIATIKTKCTKCRVYLDAGHSNWVGPAEMANRLRDAGVLSADGFSTNVSNYNTTGSEQAYGAQVLNALGNPSGIGQVIDTSRNGNGSNGEWCDPAGRAVGEAPSLNTGISHVHAFMWVKVPGEADGCIGSAGQFVPQRAYDLYTG